MLRRLYDWVLEKSEHKYAAHFLGFISFIESSVFPLPPDLLLIPMVVAKRQKAWVYALYCTLASVAGALLGYAIGFYAYQLIGLPIIEFYQAETAFSAFTELYQEWGIWVILITAITFLPYKVATIASGVVGFPLLPFILTSLVGRGARFFLVAGLLYFFGAPIKIFIEKYFNILSIAFIGLLFLGFILIL